MALAKTANPTQTFWAFSKRLMPGHFDQHAHRLLLSFYQCHFNFISEIFILLLYHFNRATDAVRGLLIATLEWKWLYVIILSHTIHSPVLKWFLCYKTRHKIHLHLHFYSYSTTLFSLLKSIFRVIISLIKFKLNFTMKSKIYSENYITNILVLIKIKNNTNAMIEM